MVQKNLIGCKDIFAIAYSFFDDSHATEIAMYANGQNILAFERNGELLTTRWNLNELSMWLREFLDNMAEDPYPVDCEGIFAAQKDDIAREFDTEDDEAFEIYYQRLYDLDIRHRWRSASAGAVLADVFFQQVGDTVEISWENRGLDEGVYFKSISGGVRVPKKMFTETENAFLDVYCEHWYRTVREYNVSEVAFLNQLPC